MEWIKKGLIFNTHQEFDWMQSHATLPVADHIKDDFYRIYFCSRNKKNYASIGYLEIDITDPKKILTISESPVISPGKLGTFDDTGVMIASIVNHEDKKYLYYTGWNQSKTVPFRWSVGLAISDDGGKYFTRFSEGPIMDRNHIDPYFTASPTVIKDGSVWKMWYISGLGWKKNNEGELIIPYNIRYAESPDGINWTRNNEFCTNFQNKEETRIGRASILKENEKYKIWYSHAGNKYRIGYAESDNGIKWKRKDGQVGITVSENGWDSEMIEYSHIFEHKKQLYMLYNGNEYGQTGFGYATLKKD